MLSGAGATFAPAATCTRSSARSRAMSAPELLEFTRMTGDSGQGRMRACPQPIVGAIDGVCAGAGAMMALACDLRYASTATQTAFLFTRVGLAGPTWAPARCCRVIGQGPRQRAALSPVAP